MDTRFDHRSFFEEEEKSYLSLGLCGALTFTLIVLWIPWSPPSPSAIPPKQKVKLPSHVVLQTASRPEEPHSFQPKNLRKPLAVPWNVEQQPDSYEFDMPYTDAGVSYDPTGWEIAEPETKPKIYTLSCKELAPPIYLKKVPPVYPRRALKLGLQGYVILGATLTRSGVIEHVVVLKGLGNDHFGFETAAIDALKQWTYLPGKVGVHPVDVRLVLRIDFRLD